MTRINVIDPKLINSKMLLAEYREITRIPNNIRKSLSRISKPFSFDEIPEEYILGKGHVKFFYNKLNFLINRYCLIVRELEERGFSLSYPRPEVFYGLPIEFYNNYQPTDKAIELNLKRISERLKK